MRKQKHFRSYVLASTGAMLVFGFGVVAFDILSPLSPLSADVLGVTRNTNSNTNSASANTNTVSTDDSSASTTPPQVVSPTHNTEIYGVTRLTARSPLFASLESYELFFRTANDLVYSRRYGVSETRTPGTTDSVELDFDTLALPNGNTEVWVCPPSGSAISCGDRVRYSIVNRFQIVSPASNEEASGRVRLSAKISGEVTYVRLEVFRNHDRVLNEVVWTRDITERYTYELDSTQLLNDDYFVQASYVPYWQQSYVMPLPSVIQRFKINNVSPSETPTPGSNTNTAPTTNVNASPSAPTNTNQSTTNTNQAPSNTNTAPSPSISEPLPAPEVIWPRKDARLYKLTQITGSVKHGQEVTLVLGLNTGNDSAGTRPEQVGKFQAPVGTSGDPRVFAFTLPILLKPGSYTLGAAAVDGNRTGEFLTLSFRILPPEVEIQTKDGTPLSGNAHLELITKGNVTLVELLATRGELPEIHLGEAQRVAGNTNGWALTFDTTAFPNGTYETYARAKGLDGLYVQSKSTTLSIENEVPVEAPTTTSPTSPTDGAVGEPEVTTIPLPEVLQDGSATEADSSWQTAVAIPTPVTVDVPIEDPRTTGEAKPEVLAIQEVSNVEIVEGVAGQIKLNGIGPPNSVVTIFIYSNPIVATTRTDANGNWSYTLDGNLADGRHEVYVTVTDDTGKIQEKSTAFQFFVAQARAVTEEEFLQTTAEASRTSDRYLVYYLVLAGLLIAGTLIIFLVIRLTKKSRDLS